MKISLLCLLAFLAMGAEAQNKITYSHHLDDALEKDVMNKYYRDLDCKGDCKADNQEYWYFLNYLKSTMKKYKVIVDKRKNYRDFIEVSLNTGDLAKLVEFKKINNEIDNARIQAEKNWPEFYEQFNDSDTVHHSDFFSLSAPNCAANGNEDADSSLDYFNNANDFAFRKKVKAFVKSQFPDELPARIAKFDADFDAEEVRIQDYINWAISRHMGIFKTADGGELRFVIYDLADAAIPVLVIANSKMKNHTRFSDFIYSENSNFAGDEFQFKPGASIEYKDKCIAAELAKAAETLAASPENIIKLGLPHDFDVCATKKDEPQIFSITDYIPRIANLEDGIITTTYIPVTTRINHEDYMARCD